MLWRLPSRFGVTRSFATGRGPDHTYLNQLLGAYDRGINREADQTPLAMDTFTSAPRMDLGRALVAAGYFDAWPKESYEEVLGYLNRTAASNEKSQTELVYLKKFELMVRCGMIPQSPFDSFSNFSKKYLMQIRSKPLAPVEPGELELDVYGILKGISVEFHDEFLVGPYSLTLARVGETGVNERTRTNGERNLRSIKSCTCVNTLGPESMIDGRTLVPDAQIKRAVLGKLGFKSVWVPYTEWQTLPSDTAKRLYLHSLVSSVS